MKAITVKYCGPTNSRGSRRVVRAEGVKSRRFPIDYRLSADESAALRAQEFAHDLGWLPAGVRLVPGVLPDGRTRAFCFSEE